MTNHSADRKTLKLVAERGPEQIDLGPAFAVLDADSDIDGVRDQQNQPVDREPLQVQRELEAIRTV